MTQIKIEVPSNDPIALSALGEALQRIATERTNVTEYFDGSEEVDKSQLTGQPSKRDIDACLESIDLKPTPIVKPDSTINVELKDDVTKREGDLVTSTDIKQVDASIVLSTDTETVGEVTGLAESDDTLDKDGLPWDKRIHSRGKTRLADDTWRLARKPNDKTQEEWDEYVASVKAELKAVQDTPTPSDTVTIATDVNNVEYQQTQGVISPDCKVEVTLDEQAPTETLTPPVVETETVTPPTLDEQAVADVQASEPVAAVEPPTSVTAPVITDNTPSVSTFQELMKYITSDAAKRGATNDMIKEVLTQVDPSLTAIPLIANRADLIPTFVAKLEGRLS